MSKKKYFQKLYKFDNDSQTYLIEVSLDNYNDVFDDWDPSPFKKRDIEDEFNDFILDSSEDIPLNHNITIVLYLPADKKDTKKENALISAYKNYYDFSLARINKVKTNLSKKTIWYMLLSVFLLTIGYFFFRSEQTLLLNVIHEGIFIGGWVFLWEFFTNIFIKGRDLQNEYKLYKRLYNSNILFIYT
jgi:hypothetical protein